LFLLEIVMKRAERKALGEPPRPLSVVKSSVAENSRQSELKEADAESRVVEDRIVLWPELASIVPLSRVTIWQMRRRGDFPAPIQLSPNRVGWRLSEVRAWIASRKAAGIASVLLVMLLSQSSMLLAISHDNSPPRGREAMPVRTTTEPVLTRTLFEGTDDVSSFYEEREGRLPRYLGSLEECGAVWQALNRKDKWTNLRRGAIAAKLERAHGQRTDRGRGLTPIQQFCREQNIGPEYVSRLARTYRAFDQPDDPEIMKLIADPRLTFKHLFIAATCSKSPKNMLVMALHPGWSANQMLRWTKERNGEFDQEISNPACDDLDLQVERLPEYPRPATRVPGTKEVSFRGLTADEYERAITKFRELRAVMRHENNTATFLAMVDRLHAELVACSKREAA
jgi:prophage regulatory protein